MIIIIILNYQFISYLKYRDRQNNSKESKRYLNFYLKKLLYYS